MHRVNAQRLQRLDLAQRPRRAEFNHVRRAHARQHQHRRQQRPQFAHHHNHHRRAEIIRRADFRQRGNRLADDQKSQRQRHKEKHRQQRHAGAGDFLPDARTDHIPRRPGFSQDDAQRDERKRRQPLHRQQKQEQLPPQQIRVGFRQLRPAKQLRVRQVKRLGQIFPHKPSVGLVPGPGQKSFSTPFNAARQ